MNIRRRLFAKTLLAVLALPALALAGPAGPAGAQGVVANDVPGTLWIIPGNGNLDALLQWVYVAPPPEPGPGQVSPSPYGHTVQFFTSSGLPGYLTLAIDAEGHPYAGFNLGDWVSTPFSWEPGRLYALMAYPTGPDTWGGYVYDATANTWTAIGQRTFANVGNTLLPLSRTHVITSGSSGSAATCADYPRSDTFFVPTVGLRGGVSTLGQQLGPYVQAGACPSQVNDVSGWVHYQLGALPTP